MWRGPPKLLRQCWKRRRRAAMIGHLRRDTKYHFDRNSHSAVGGRGVWNQCIDAGKAFSRDWHRLGDEECKTLCYCVRCIRLRMLEETSAFITSYILSLTAVRCHSSCMEDGRAIQLLSSGASSRHLAIARDSVCVCCDRLEQWHLATRSCRIISDWFIILCKWGSM